MKLERLSVKYGRRKNFSPQTPAVRIFAFLSFPYPLTCFFTLGITLLLTLGLWARDSSVGIATRYGLDGPGIESRGWGGGEIFRTRPDRPWEPSSLLYNGYRVSFPGGKAAGAWR